MKMFYVALLLITAAVVCTAEDCGGRGTHIKLRVGSCDDETNGECVLPTEQQLTLSEDLVLSEDSARIVFAASIQTPLGTYVVGQEFFDDLVGGQQYSISQDLILGPQLAGQHGTFFIQIFDVESSQLEVCGLFPNFSIAE